MTHQIVGSEAIDRHPHEPPLAYRQVFYTPRSGMPWKAIGFYGLGIVCGVLLIVVPAAIEAYRHG